MGHQYAGSWSDFASGVVDEDGRTQWSAKIPDEGLNSVQVGQGKDYIVIDVSNQPLYEERMIAVCKDGRELVSKFQKSVVEGKNYLNFQDLKMNQIKEFKLQRRPYDWVEFRNVPTDWSETPVRSASRVDNTCNIYATPAGRWKARLPSGPNC